MGASHQPFIQMDTNVVLAATAALGTYCGYALCNHETGMYLYKTWATPEEIFQANKRLQQHANTFSFVPLDKVGTSALLD